MDNLDVLNEKGEFTGEILGREECHKRGLYHKAVAVFILNSQNEILIQRRSGKKKLWPNKWDITAGGHVLSKEFGYQAAIREVKEELGIDLDVKDLLFIGTTISNTKSKDIINNHFDEFYIVRKNININNIVLQQEEVSDIKWISKDKLIEMITSKDDELTTKWNCWNYLKRYLEMI